MCLLFSPLSHQAKAYNIDTVVGFFAAVEKFKGPNIDGAFIKKGETLVSTPDSVMVNKFSPLMKQFLEEVAKLNLAATAYRPGK